jgi:hypothetical protein
VPYWGTRWRRGLITKNWHWRVAMLNRFGNLFRGRGFRTEAEYYRDLERKQRIVAAPDQPRDKFCGKCGNPLYGDPKFCGICGAAVSTPHDTPTQASARRRPPRLTNPTRTVGFTIECWTCGKKFRRESPVDTALKPHKSRDGLPCVGRDGFPVPDE